ncbi:MAG: hypothetical protein AAF604_17035 [Acidobacteriota bacterium]
MTAALHLLAFELRRHLPGLLVCLGVLLSMPLFHRWLEGHWDFWSGDWPLSVAALGFGLMLPFLALSTGLGTWAADRSRGTLGWLYARPVGGVLLFSLRVLGVVLVVGIFFAAVMVITGLGVGGLLRDLLNLTELAGWVVRVGLLLTPLLGAIGLLASSLGSGPGRAVLIALGVLLLLALVIPWVATSQGTLPVLWSSGEPLLLQILIAAVGVAAAVLVLAAGRAVRHSPSDAKRARRALWVLGPGLLLLLAGLLLAARVPLLPRGDEVLATLPMGGDRELRFVPARGLDHALARPLLVAEDGSASVVSDLFVPVGSVFADPGGGGAIVADYGELVEWRYIQPGGAVDRLQLKGRRQPPMTLPIGWSPDGRRFAWLTFEARSFVSQGLMVYEGSSELRWVPFASFLPYATRARWWDSEHWVVLDDPAARPERWRIVALDGEEVRGPAVLPPQVSLGHASLPHRLVGFRSGEDSSWAVETRRASHATPRFGDHWLARQISGEGRGWVLVAPDGKLEPYPHLSLRGFVTVGTTAEGAPLRATAEGVIERLDREGGATEICRFPTRAGWFAGFRGPWAVWLARRPAELRLACQVETGEVRTRHIEGPAGLFEGFAEWERYPAIDFDPEA